MIDDDDGCPKCGEPLWLSLGIPSQATCRDCGAVYEEVEGALRLVGELASEAARRLGAVARHKTALLTYRTSGEREGEGEEASVAVRFVVDGDLLYVVGRRGDRVWADALERVIEVILEIASARFRGFVSPVVTAAEAARVVKLARRKYRRLLVWRSPAPERAFRIQTR